MGAILLNFDYDSDVVMCPDEVSCHLKSYQRAFDKWISNSLNQNGYWIKDHEGHLALCFDGEAFVNWLNEVALVNGEELAFFIKRHIQPSDEDKQLPHINF